MWLFFLHEFLKIIIIYIFLILLYFLFKIGLHYLAYINLNRYILYDYY